MPTGKRLYTPRELALIVLFSSLGAVVSVPVGYLGNLLKTVPGLPLGTGQLLSGIHVLWIILPATMIKKRWTATTTGAIKGLVEMTLFSYHGATVLLISGIEGLVAEITLTPFKETDTKALTIAGGLSSASNVAVLQFIIGIPMPSPAYALMYTASFISGAFFAGYIGRRVLKTAETLLHPEKRIPQPPSTQTNQDRQDDHRSPPPSRQVTRII